MNSARIGLLRDEPSRSCVGNATSDGTRALIDLAIVIYGFAFTATEVAALAAR